jgi:phosphate transport system substrate-binding protein
VASRSRVLFAAAALIPFALAAACGSSGGGSSSSSSPSAASSKPAALPTGPASASASLSETGSTLLYPLFGTWATAYHGTYSQVKITTAGTGSGTGISDAAAGTVQIGASDAYLSPGDLTKYPGLLNIPLAVSALMVNYNVPGVSPSTHLKLDGKILAQMYSGKITSWNNPAIAALNPGVKLPSTKVVPLHRSDSSGSTFLFTSYLNGQDPSDWTSTNVNTTVSWPTVSGQLGETGSGGMVTGCKSTPGCIAYIGTSYLKKTTAANVGEAQVANKAGSYVLPTTSAVNAALSSFPTTPANEAMSLINGSAPQGYPIINYEYAIVNTKQSSATDAQDVKAFLHWAITTGNGSTYLGPVNFVPLPSQVVSLSDAQISKIGS